MRALLLSIATLALVACGSKPDPKPAAADDTVRPPIHGCAACRIEACYMADTPNRLSRVTLHFEPTVDDKPAAARDWQRATVEVKPAKGFAQTLKVDVSKWNPTGKNMTAVKDPDLKPSPSGWDETTGTIQVFWKDGGQSVPHKYDGIPVTISQCK